MRRMTTALLALIAMTCATWVQADVTVIAVRLGATDVAALAKFYDTVFGLKEIDRVGQPPHEIIMRYGASVAEAKAGTSPEFLLVQRDAKAASDTIPHAVFRVSDIGTTVTAAKNAGATVKNAVTSAQIGKMPLKFAMLTDPDGNVLELMELPKGASHIQHP